MLLQILDVMQKANPWSRASRLVLLDHLSLTCFRDKTSTLSRAKTSGPVMIALSMGDMSGFPIKYECSLNCNTSITLLALMLYRRPLTGLVSRALVLV